ADELPRQVLIVDAAEAGEFAVGAACGDGTVVGPLDVRMAELAGNPHFGAEVVRADQEHVDPFDRRDLLGIADRFRTFEHHDDQRVLVLHARELADGQGLVFQLRRTAGDGAMADRRIAAIAHDALRLRRGVDVRHDDALGPAVERPRRVEMLVPCGANDGRDPRVERSHADLHGCFHRHRVVLHVDEQPVIAAYLRYLGDIDGAGLAYADPQRQLARLKLVLGLVAYHGHRGISLPCRFTDRSLPPASIE